MKKGLWKKICAGALAAAVAVTSLPTEIMALERSAGLTLAQTVGGVRIELTADEGVFPADAVLDAREISAASEIGQIEEAVQAAIDADEAKSGTVEATASFDIRVLDALGNELQPDTSAGSVQVVFSNIESDKTLEVYHVDDALTTAEPVESTMAADGSVEISPEHFSIYVITVSTNSTQIRYYKGSTDATSYFMIYTAEQLEFFRNVVNGAITGTISVVTEYEDGNTVASGVEVSTLGTNAKLMNDIDLNPGTTFAADGTHAGSPTTWVPIGLTTTARYGGTFNGDGHTISNLYIPAATNSSKMGVGFFGWLSSGASIKNLTIDGAVNVNTFTYVGGIVGYATSATIINCTNNAYVTGSSHVGGIVGYGNGTIYEDCVNNGTIKAVTNNVGGIAGALGDGSATTTTNIEHCSNNGSIASTTSSNVGGLVGYVTSGYVSILNSCNTGAINGIGNIGGLVGYNKGKVYNSYNQGIVTADNYAGGICGYSDTTGGIYGVYNSASVTTTYNVVGGIVGNNKSPMQYVYNTANVTSISGYLAGGIVGSNYASFSYGYNTGEIKAFYHVGGIAGALQASGVTLAYCYSQGKATSIANHSMYKSSVGGIVGYSEGTINATCEAKAASITFYNGATAALNGLGPSVIIGYADVYYAGMVLGYPNTTSVCSGKYNSALSMPTVVSVMSTFSNTSTSYKTWTSTGGSAGAPVFLNTAPAVIADTWTIDGYYADSFAGGDGSPMKPYQIATAAQLARLAYLTSDEYISACDDLYLTRSYVLTSDIDLSAHHWLPIGYKRNVFNGVFDGNGYKILNLKYTLSDYMQGGLFYSNAGTVKNVTLTGVNINGGSSDNQMGVIAKTNSGTINNVNVSGNMTLTSSVNAGVRFGGFVGVNSGTIINAISQVNINTTHSTTTTAISDIVGGIAGDSSDANSKIYNSAATGKIIVVSPNIFSYVGGIAGTSTSGYIRNCYYYNATAISNTGSTSYAMTGGITARTGNDIYYYYTSEAEALSSNRYLTSLFENKTHNPLSYNVSSLNTSDTSRAGYLTWETLTSFAAPESSWIENDNYADSFAGGDGTADNPYRIATGAQLARLAYLSSVETAYCGKNYILTADVDLSEHPWVAVGGVGKTAFTGVLDGNGKTISGLSGAEYGMFYQLKGTLENLVISDGAMSLTASGGMITEYNYGLIENVRVLGGSVTATISGVTNADVGGMVGSNSGTLLNCISTASVSDTHTNTTGQDKVGGIVGANGGKIVNCGSQGNVTTNISGGTAYAAGIAGANTSTNSLIQIAYYIGTITTSGSASTTRYSIVAYNPAAVKYVYGVSGAYSCNPSGGTSTGTSATAATVDSMNSYVSSYSETYATKKWATMTSFVATDTSTWIAAGNYAGSFAGGSGATSDPYQIATAAQLARLAYLSTTDESYLAKSYILTEDIDLSAHQWIAIGGGVYNSQKIFSGVFNGNGKSITGLTSNTTQGLFAANSGTIKNLKLDVAITGSSTNLYIAGLLRNNASTGTVDNVTLTGSINISSTTYGNLQVGGIVASNWGKIINAITQVNITSSHSYDLGNGQGGDHIGGIAGTNTNGSAAEGSNGNILNCAANNIKIIATSSNYGNSVGGIVGTNYGPVRNCYFVGVIDRVTAANYSFIGGIAGSSGSDGTIKYYYNSSAIDPITSAKKTSPYIDVSTAMAYDTLLNELNTRQPTGRDGFLTWATLTSFVPVANAPVNVTLTAAHISGDGVKLTGSGNTYTGTVTPASSFVTTLIPDAGYKCPSSIAVTIGGASYTGYIYNAETGELTIPASAITGDIAISANGAPISYSVVYHSGGTGAPSLGAAATTADGETVYKQTVTYGTAASYAAQGAMTAAGWTFGGWATSAEAASATYSAGTGIGNLTLMDSAEIHLYAFWTVTGGSASYPISLQNGSFEQPLNSNFYNAYTGATSTSNPNNIFWRTTASDNQIELGSVKGGYISGATSAYHTSEARDGYQFAELNANLVGALYQDVSTIPGSTLYYGFSHKARAGTETMDLWLGSPAVIDQAIAIYKKYTTGTTVTTGTGRRKTTTTTTITLAEAQAQIAALSGLVIVRDTVNLVGYNDWKDISGSYAVPTGQSTTRFAFVSWSSPASNSVGNLLDNVYFSRSKPVKTANVVVRTTLGGYVVVNDSSPANTTVETAEAPYDKSLTYGTPLKLTVVADSGYTFNGGYINGTLYQSKEAFLTACNNMTWTIGDDSPAEITILFSKDSTVSFALQGGEYNIAEKTLTASAPDDSCVLGTPTRDGYEFTGWTIAGTSTVLNAGTAVTYNTAANGATTLNAGSYSTPTENGMILIAGWIVDRSILPDVKISFVDGDYTAAPVTFADLGNKLLNKSATAFGAIPAPTKENCAFDSWYCGLTDKYYTGITAISYAMTGDYVPTVTVTYDGGTETFKNATDIVFEAVWNPQYTVAYNGNAVSGMTVTDVPENQTCVYGTAFDVASAPTPSLSYYSFSGWNTKADGTGTSFAAGESASNLALTGGTTVTLYAQWELTDTTAPTLTISNGELDWNSFRSGFTFPDFYNANKTITLTATDDGSGIKPGTLKYYIDKSGSLTPLSEEALKSADWQDYDPANKPLTDIDSKYVVYAIVSDNAGYTTIVNSNGFVIDAASPVISGVTDGAELIVTNPVSVSVTDVNLQSVVVYTNGSSSGASKTVAGTSCDFALPAPSTGSAEYRILATDRAGNTSEKTVTLIAATYGLALTAPVFADETYGYAGASSKPVQLTGTGNSSVTVSSVTITGADADKFTLTGPSDATIAPTGTDTQYLVKPHAGLNAGTYTAVVTATYSTGKTVSDAVTFTVKPKTLEFAWSTPNAFVYDGNAHGVNATPTNLLNGDSVTLSYANSGNNVKTAVNSGSYTAAVTGIVGSKNYTVTDSTTASKPWSIGKKTPELAPNASSISVLDNGSATVDYVYDGDGAVSVTSGNENVVTVSIGNADKKITVNPLMDGTATLTLTSPETNNFTGATATLVVTVYDGKLIVAAGYDGVYDGQPHGISVAANIPDVTVEYSADNINFTTTNPTETNVTVTAKTVYYKVTASNGSVLATGSQTVNVSRKTLTVTAENKTVAYGGEAPVYTVSITGFVSGENASTVTGSAVLTSDYTATSDAGEYDITASAGSLTAQNYDFVFEKGVLKVTPRVLEFGWSQPLSFDYDESEKTVEAQPTNLANGDEITVLCVDNAQTNAGSYTALVAEISGEKSGNYTLSGSTGTSVSWSIAPATNSFGETPLTMPDAVYGDELMPDCSAIFGTPIYLYSDDPEGDFTEEKPVTAGTYYVKAIVPATSNYNLLETATPVEFTIRRRVVTINWGTLEFVYDGRNPTVTAGAGNLAYGDNVTLTVVTENTARVGTHTAEVTALSDADNYELPAERTGTYRIYRAPEPPVTEPPVTEPPVTEPPVTEPDSLKDERTIETAKDYELEIPATELTQVKVNGVLQDVVDGVVKLNLKAPEKGQSITYYITGIDADGNTVMHVITLVNGVSDGNPNTGVAPDLGTFALATTALLTVVRTRKKTGKK